MLSDFKIDPILEKAKSWAAHVWKEATSTWAERPSQDHAYREHLVNPAISEVIQQLSLDKSSSVEIGCTSEQTCFASEQIQNKFVSTYLFISIKWL